MSNTSIVTGLIQEERQALEDHCGIIAAYAPYDFSFFPLGLKGLTVLQTRGYDGAGFWAKTTKDKTFAYKNEGMVHEVFNTDVVDNFANQLASMWIYQVRYGTDGGFSQNNVQPVVRTHLDGSVFAVAHNGQFSKTHESEKSDLSDTVLFANELAKTPGKEWDERIQTCLSQKKGAWSLVIGTKNTLYLARDPFGFRPLTYGHIWDPGHKSYFWVAASETSALEKMGVVDFFEVLPGTIAKLTNAGMRILSRIKGHKKAVCVFENIYIHHGSGKAHLPRMSVRKIQDSPTVDEIRRRTGKILAREAPLSKQEVNMVIGVPGTGIAGGMSFARELDLPYFQAITDKVGPPAEQRTFMTANIGKIYEKVLNHFNFDAQALKTRKVVLVDDSIVRGNITRGLVYLLKNYYGVAAVHVRVLSPAIDKACHLGVNTRSSHELIAAINKGDVEKIRISIGADSLAYLTTTGLRTALIGDSQKNGFCMGCMAGEQYPIDEYGNLVRSHVKRIVTAPKFKKEYPKIPRLLY